MPGSAPLFRPRHNAAAPVRRHRPSERHCAAHAGFQTNLDISLITKEMSILNMCGNGGETRLWTHFCRLKAYFVAVRRPAEVLQWGNCMKVVDSSDQACVGTTVCGPVTSTEG